jgi:glycosyltransferase involved in cell wall biosynthesis
VILYQGGFSKNRGLRSLILSTRYFDRGKLVMMGWGNVEEELKAFTRSKELADNVFFIPPVTQSELLSWSSSADLGVIPYRAIGLNNYYSCPNKLFEYINAGLPVAGSDFPELRKIINGWEIGRTFDPEDPQSIGRAINGILAEKYLLEEMHVNSVHASRTLNWQCESEKLLGVYSGFKKQHAQTPRQEGDAIGGGQLPG